MTADDEQAQALLDVAALFGLAVLPGERAVTDEPSRESARLTAERRQAAADRDELIQRRNIEQARGFIEVQIEKTICRLAHVDWQLDGSHARDIGIIREQSEQVRKLSADVATLQEIIREHNAAKERKSTLGRSVLLQFGAVIVGAVSLQALYWLDKATGLHLSGGAP